MWIRVLKMLLDYIIIYTFNLSRLNFRSKSIIIHNNFYYNMVIIWGSRTTSTRIYVDSKTLFTMNRL